MATTRGLPIRRWIVRTTIGSFSIAALMGIIALLSGGEFGPLENRVLLTTLLVGTVSIAVLCYLATAGRRWQPVGIAGGVSVLVPLACGLVSIWGTDLDRGPSEGLGRTLGIGAIVAATLAQASLLLAVADAARTVVTRLLAGTLTMATTLVAMTSVLILGYEPHGNTYFRLLGVVAILDVLGTVVVAALVKFGPSTQESVPAHPLAGTGPGPGAAPLPPDLRAGVAAYAAAHQIGEDEVIIRAVRGLLGREGVTTAQEVPGRAGSGSGITG